jgi:hypothetical protein
MEFPLDTVRLLPAADKKPAVSDIRLTLCPKSVGDIYLTAFLDSLDYTSAVQWNTPGVPPIITDASTGALKLDQFPERGTFTFSFTRFSECGTSSTVGKAYVHITTGKIPSRHDTVVICYEQAAAVNISAIFGLELGGNYDNGFDPSWRSTTALGATIFNGQTAYDEATSVYEVTYRGASGKAFTFEYRYDASGCNASGKTKITIMITD